ncbi:hypothetical protein MSAN_02449800 [Mycena sanguinolenta]|uniref:Uncharacterized protein n=1 Tax=Mycena sanguinolenta TaxID=230812 RepID=A0A8H6WXW4_9AGAR|nr:hypothetical protein MSAN_02449800 [Mycena sanguinolenta]
MSQNTTSSTAPDPALTTPVLSIASEPTATDTESNNSDDIPDLVPADSNDIRPPTPVVHRRAYIANGLTNSLGRLMFSSPVYRGPIVTGSPFAPRIHDIFAAGAHLTNNVNGPNVPHPRRYTVNAIHGDFNWQASSRISGRAIRDAVADRLPNPASANDNLADDPRGGHPPNARYRGAPFGNAYANNIPRRAPRQNIYHGLNPRMILRLIQRLQNPNHTRGLDTRMVFDLIRRLQGLVHTLQNMREDEFLRML